MTPASDPTEDAFCLILAHGDVEAYAIARREARTERAKLRRPGPWDRIRQEVGRITGRDVIEGSLLSNGKLTFIKELSAWVARFRLPWSNGLRSAPPGSRNQMVECLA